MSKVRKAKASQVDTMQLKRGITVESHIYFSLQLISSSLSCLEHRQRLVAHLRLAKVRASVSPQECEYNACHQVGCTLLFCTLARTQMADEKGCWHAVRTLETKMSNRGAGLFVYGSACVCFCLSEWYLYADASESLYSHLSILNDLFLKWWC